MVELVVVIGVIAIVTGVGISTYVKARQQQRLNITVDRVRSALELAKDMAISNNTPCQLKVDPPVSSSFPIKVSVSVLSTLSALKPTEFFLDDGIGFYMQTTATWSPFLNPPPCKTASWTSGYAYNQGNMVNNNGYTYICTNTGTSGSNTPSWPTSIGSPVTDGGISWTCISPLIFYPDGTTNCAISVQFYLNDGSQFLTTAAGGFTFKRIDAYPGGMIKVMKYNGTSWY